jgi:hypothetical protein
MKRSFVLLLVVFLAAIIVSPLTSWAQDVPTSEEKDETNDIVGTLVAAVPGILAGLAAILTAILTGRKKADKADVEKKVAKGDEFKDEIAETLRDEAFRRSFVAELVRGETIRLIKDLGDFINKEELQKRLTRISQDDAFGKNFVVELVREETLELIKNQGHFISREELGEILRERLQGLEEFRESSRERLAPSEPVREPEGLPMNFVIQALVFQDLLEQIRQRPEKVEDYVRKVEDLNQLQSAEGVNEEVESLKEQLRIHRENLRCLNVNAAHHGMDIPISLQSEIKFEKNEIKRLEDRLARYQGGMSDGE